MDKLSISPCNLCPRECNVRREEGQTGYCRSDDRIFIARAALHMWEEPCISGKKGSGTVFFSGCNLRCVYCQNYEIAAGGRGKAVSVERLAQIFLELQKQGAANINLVTPDHYVPGVVRAVLMAKEQGLVLPVVYNCSGYAKREVIKSLTGIVDIFLTDFKYMDPALAAKYSAAPDYPDAAREALDEMVNITYKESDENMPLFDETGMMQRGVIVRHLLLPGHKKNAREVLRYVYETYGDSVYISLMNQYTPFDRLRDHPEYGELGRKVTKREYESVVDYAIDLGITNAYIQDGDTARESFIPPFDVRKE
ncbi:MAG: radical SAM protein [Lachnospiraceae bacterium]|nr:radical SAM protein [Lachnospiraceae bacterium]